MIKSFIIMIAVLLIIWSSFTFNPTVGVVAFIIFVGITIITEAEKNGSRLRNIITEFIKVIQHK